MNKKTYYDNWYSANYKILKSYRRFVINGEDYYFIIEAVFNNIKIFDQVVAINNAWRAAIHWDELIFP